MLGPIGVPGSEIVGKLVVELEDLGVIENMSGGEYCGGENDETELLELELLLEVLLNAGGEYCAGGE